MLLSPTEILQAYDVPSPVLDLLQRSAVKHVSIFARRGPLESAFTTKEIRELINLPNAAMVPLDPTILDTTGSTLTRQQSRIFQLLRKGSKQPFGATEKTWSLDFFRSPTGIVTPPVGSSSKMAQLSLAHTSVDPMTKRAVVTSESTTILTSLVVTSIGFQSEPSNPFYDPGLRHLRTVSGRLVSSHGDVIRNAYASGWASMGPKGVLASTMIDAFSVAETMLADFASAEPLPSSGHEELQLNASPDVDLESIPLEVAQGLREGNVIGYPDWQRIDAEEIKRGEALGKERERMEWEEAKAYLSLSS
ncbi:hypothetical protein ONZ45_g5861 [Pleurotus djamor]|nr:hypothetical protein ONZ45_g5861 [Pleurotus djamor]